MLRAIISSAALFPARKIANEVIYLHSAANSSKQMLLGGIEDYFSKKMDSHNAKNKVIEKSESCLTNFRLIEGCG